MKKIAQKNAENHPGTSGTESIRARVAMLLQAEKLGAGKRRLLVYLAAHPGAWTDELSRACSVSYPPARFHELRPVLFDYGLAVEVRRPKNPRRNQFGGRSNVHQCFLVQIH